MSNKHYARKSLSERIELKDILKHRRHPAPLSSLEKAELENYLKRKRLLLYDYELDSYKEEK
jgi:hypothetical protein